MTTLEHKRLAEDLERSKNWKRWGPYLSERSWGTVREDYSPHGDVWSYLPHEHSRSKAYRWGEDGLLGITDRECRLCFSLALWNGKDPILKERLFGLGGNEGNHGEDCKEHYFYLASSPTHSYMKGLYKYPMREYPYADLVKVNKERTLEDREYEISDTGVFDDEKYWDVSVEYAKDDDNDILIKITILNRSDDEEIIHVLPTLWHRNQWSFEGHNPPARIEIVEASKLKTQNPTLGNFYFECESFGSDSELNSQKEAPTKWLFTENNTNRIKLNNTPNKSKYVKDAFHDYICNGIEEAVNPLNIGSKAAAYHQLKIKGKSQAVIKLRLYKDNQSPKGETFGKAFDEIFKTRIAEMDEYYDTIIPKSLLAEEKNVVLQGFAGLLWTKQFYFYVVQEWLDGDPNYQPPPEVRKMGRNSDWLHLYNFDVISMPDKWEYPWYAVWDLAFHMVSFALFDIEFAKQQLVLFLREWYMHPNGCLPAYEFNFGDVNPPVHAWAVWKVYKKTGPYGKRDTSFLLSCFTKLVVNFTWWVNRKDPSGKNVFSGGFLGLDNIGALDRSQQLPFGERLDQADGTSWMAFYCMIMLKISIELALFVHSSYEDMASKFFEHFVLIAGAINNVEKAHGLWDEEDGFYYDQIVSENGKTKMKIRSIVGLLPLIASGVLLEKNMETLIGFDKRTRWFLENRKDLAKEIIFLRHQEKCPIDKEPSLFLSIPKKKRITRLLDTLFDESEFLSNYGIRSMSKIHEEFPFNEGGYCCSYIPGESKSKMFGGNSNWRGPIWMPINFLLIESLQKFDSFYSATLKVEVPKGSGNFIKCDKAAIEICERISHLFLPLPSKNFPNRPIHGKDPFFLQEENRHLIYFYEHFHGCNGRGLGATHQTGWTALVTNCLFKVAEARDKFTSEMGDKTKEFVTANLNAFIPSTWSDEVKCSSRCHALGLARLKLRYETVSLMMEELFAQCPWRYISLLYKYARSLRLD